MSRVYPDEPARDFERPPLSFTDETGSEITIRPYGSAVANGESNAGSEGTDESEENDESEGNGTDDGGEFDAVFEMYVAFDPADRAQGIPPTREPQIREWLETILADGYDVLAWDDAECVGHATLVPDDDDAYELAIFVASERQHVGIGSQLMEGLLGYGQEGGVRRVWLTVERWNDVAMALYRKVGFETSNAESFELEMGLRLQ